VKKKLLISTVQVFFIKGFGAAAAFLLTISVTNVVDSHTAGLFLFSITLITVLGTIATLGAPQALIRIVGANFENDWRKVNSYFSIIFKVVALVAAFLALMLFLFSDFISNNVFNEPKLNEIMPLLAISFCLFAGVQVYASSLLGQHKSSLGSLVQNVITPASFIVFLGAFYFIKDLDLLDLSTLYLVSLVLAITFGVIHWHRCPKVSLTYVAGFPTDLKDRMYPLFVVSLMTLSSAWASQFAIAYYLQGEDIAYFSSAQRTALLTSFVLVAVNVVVSPRFANAFERGADLEINKLALLSSRFMVLLATPVLLFMFVFSEWVVSLFGEEYIVAAPLLKIIAVGQFINVMTGSVGYLLTMTGHEKDFRNVVLFSGPLAIVLSFFLTSMYGLTGAAYATAISLATQNLLAVYMVKMRLGFNTLNLFRRV